MRTAASRLYLLVGIGVCLHIGFAGCPVNLSLFALHLGASAFTVGLIISLLGLVPLMFSVHAGRAIDRIGVRLPLLAGATAQFVAIALPVAMPRLETLFLTSCLGGAGWMLFYMAVIHFAGLCGRPEDRARNFNVLALGFSTSGFVGPTLAGFAIDAMGHRWTFLLLACFVLAALLALTALRIDGEPQEHRAGSGGQRRVMDLLRNAMVRNVVLVSGILTMGWELFAFVVPIHGSQTGLSASEIGVVLGAFGAAIFAVRLAMPVFLRRVREWQVLVGAMLVTGAAFFAYPLVSGMALLLALSCAVGAGVGSALPMVMSLIYSTAPPGRSAEAVGLRALLVNASQLAMPLLFGALGTAVGMTPLFWAMGAGLLAAGYLARRHQANRPT